MANSRRISVDVPAELAAEIDEIKRRDFWAAPNTAVYRYLLSLGIEANKQQRGQN